MPVRVFISYSHDSNAHRDRVLALADHLRADGIEAQLDQYVAHPPEGWPAWAQQQIIEADFTILVCTPTYKRRFEGKETTSAGQGTTWEAWLLRQELYEAGARNHKILPVLFPEDHDPAIPRVLRPFACYRLPAAYDDLVRHITGQPRSPAPPVGPPRVLLPSRRLPGHESQSPGNPSKTERFGRPRATTVVIGLAILAGAAWAWRSASTTPSSTPAQLDPPTPATTPATTPPDDEQPGDRSPPVSLSEPTPAPGESTATTGPPPEPLPTPPPTTRSRPKRSTSPPSPTPTSPPTDPRRWTARAVIEDPSFVGRRLALDGPPVSPGTILTLAARCEAPATSTAGPRCRVLDDPEGLSCQLTHNSTIPADSTLCIHPQGTNPDPR